MADKRSSARHPVSLGATLEVSGVPFECTVKNLSLGGALLSASSRHAMGAPIEISFHIPNREDPIAVSGVVRWSDETTVGVQFDGLRARDVWALNEFFKRVRT